MKIGIITYSSAHNNGALLQTYALQTYLEKIGYEVEIINYRPKNRNGLFVFEKNQKKNINAKISFYLKNKKSFEKFDKFENFRNNYLNLTKPFKKTSELYDEKLNYDIFIAGSDQIWNGKISKGLNSVYFLDFADKKSKKIAFAASIGVSTLSENESQVFRRYLRNFDFISVREETAKKNIKQFTNKKIETVFDPTFLLNNKEYEKLIVNPKYNKEYIYLHLLGQDANSIEIAKKISQKLKIPIIHNQAIELFSNEIKQNKEIGPREFLGLIFNAKFVITNSFHGTIFSIIFKKNFITIPHKHYPSRTENLLNKLNLNQNMISDVEEIKKISSFTVDYSKVDLLIKKEKQKSITFLNNSLKSDKFGSSTLKSYFKTSDKFSCYGCYACYESCPTGAITMEEDFEGFKYPIIDQSKCIHCGICESKCIYNNEKLLQKENNYPIVYALFNKKLDIVKESTSGGVFISFAKHFIEKNGYVVGVKYNKNMEVIHDFANTIEECKAFSGSKYVRSDISGVFRKVKKLLEQKIMVLFTGTPCQIAGLRSFLGKDYNNLLCLEIICRSNPSPKVFAKYIEYLNDKVKSKVIGFKFRDKSSGWTKPEIKIIFDNGFEIKEPARLNNFNRAFSNSIMSRPSCYSCEFTKENRVGDITIGDFWGIDKIDPEIHENLGTSLMIINNKKGFEIFDKIKKDFNYKEKNIEEAFLYNHRFPIQLNEKRETFFQKIDSENIFVLLRSFNDLVKDKKSKKVVAPTLNKKVYENITNITFKEKKLINKKISIQKILIRKIIPLKVRKKMKLILNKIKK